MATTKNTLKTDGNPSASQLLGRTVADKIRDRMPNDSYLFKLVKKSDVSTDGVVTQSAGLITKKSSQHSRVEAFTHAPKSVTQSPSSVSSLVLTFSSVAGINEKMLFMNTANEHVGIVASISSTDVTFVAVGGSFTVVAGDTLLFMGYDYEYGSESPKYVTNTDDNIYNIMNIERHPIETSLSAKDSTQEAGGNLFDRYKMYEFTHATRAIERNFIWGKRASSGNTTTVGSDSIPTSRGLWDMAQSNYSFNGDLTFAKIVENLPNAFDNSIDYNKDMLWFMGKRSRARIIGMMQDNLLRDAGKNFYDKYGVKGEVLVTSGPNLTIVAHDAFNYGSNVTKGMIFLPESIEYRYKVGSTPGGGSGSGRDLQINTGIQSNSKDSQKDEVFAELCLLDLSGGYNIVKTTEMIEQPQ